MLARVDSRIMYYIKSLTLYKSAEAQKVETESQVRLQRIYYTTSGILGHTASKTEVCTFVKRGRWHIL